MEPKASDHPQGLQQGATAETIFSELKSWRRLNLIWQVIHYVLGVGGTLLSAAVASKVLTVGEGAVWPWLATAFVGLLTLLSPMKRAKAYYDAYTEVNDAYLRYRTSQIREEDMLNKYRDGRKMIGTALAP